MKFGDHIRTARLNLQDNDRRYSVRQVALKVGIEPSYLSKVERGLEAPPSIGTIKRLAEVLNEDTDKLLALGGKISPDLTAAIVRRPQLLAPLIRALNSLPDDAVEEMMRGMNQRPQ